MHDEAFQLAAQWYDGQNAVRHEGEAVWDGGDSLRLAAPTSRMEVPLSDLAWGEERGGQKVYKRTCISPSAGSNIIGQSMPPGASGQGSSPSFCT